MAKKVSIDNLTAEITQAIQQYTEDVSKGNRGGSKQYR